MLLQSPEASPYDWQFTLFGFPVRIAWTFWLVAAVLGYSGARSLDEIYAQSDLQTPGMAILLLIWIGVLFVSILIHELGHAVAFRFYGVDSRIVLYHFGGLAIPDGFLRWQGARQRRIGPVEQLIISAAGPASQLLLGSLVAGIAVALGYSPGMLHSWLDWIGVPLPSGLTQPGHAAVASLIDDLIWINFVWALLNLVPILPLDGGRIAQSLIAMKKGSDGLFEASVVSIACGCLLGAWALQNGSQSTGMMLIILGLSNLETLQNHRQRW